MSGAVYLLSNPAMPGLLKIGMTRRGVLERVKALSRDTGVPAPFRLLAYIETSRPEALEWLIHYFLEPTRPNPRREFFAIGWLVAAFAFSAVAHEEEGRLIDCGLGDCLMQSHKIPLDAVRFEWEVQGRREAIGGYSDA